VYLPGIRLIPQTKKYARHRGSGIGERQRQLLLIQMQRLIYPDTALKAHIAILKLQTILKLQIPDAFTLIHDPETLERDREIY
jgi:hypothetical protein